MSLMPHDSHKRAESVRIKNDLEKFLSAGGKIEYAPILWRDDDILAGGRIQPKDHSGGRPPAKESLVSQARLLNAAGWSRGNIAKRLDVDRTTITRWLQS